MNEPEVDELAGPDGGDESRRLANYWKTQLEAIKDNSQFKRWNKRGMDIVKRYRDERTRDEDDGQRHYNSLWSNVEILKPALYGKIPLPVVERRFKDKDPAGRNASQMLERALRNEIEICGFNDSLNAAVSDYLLPGRGVVWVRYEPKIEESVSLPLEPQVDMKDAQGTIQGLDTTRDDAEPDEDDTEVTPGGRTRMKLREDTDTTDPDEPPSEGGVELSEQKLMDTGDRILRESTPVDYIPWEDFFTFPIRARSWTEVTAIGKRVYMSRQQMIRRFGKVIGKKIPLQKDDRGDRTQNTTLQAAEQDKGQVIEIWSKDDETVYWIAEGYEYLCDRKDDPLTLENFWPVPKPLFANPTNNTIIPVPDYIQYQDQAVQIDELTQRIAMLTKACKMAGVYNAAAKDIQRLFNESVENELIPVDDWAAFAEKGGVEGNWSLMPVAEIIQIVNELMIAKQKQIEEMDRLTGINDIMRGTSDARETLGGVRLRTNSSGTRLTSRQNEVARFARDTLRIMADIMSQHFSHQSLIEVSGALYEEGLGPDDMPSLSAPTAPPQMGAMPPHPMVPGAPQAPAQSGMPQPGPMGAAPPPQMGGNVVPFRGPVPPGAPPAPPQPGAAPGMPPAGPMMPPGPPQPVIPPEVQAKIDALTRIAKAIALLRNEQLRGFRVDIEVDSTIYGDQAQDKQDRTQFVVATTQYLQQAAMLGAQMPEMVPLLGKMLQFAARGHRIGRDLELAIEEFTDQATMIAKQNQVKAQTTPSPEQQKMQMEQKKTDAQLQIANINAQTEKARGQSEIQSNQLKNASEQHQAQAEVQRQAVENAGNQANAQAEMAKANADQEMMQTQRQIELIKLQIELKKLEAASSNAEKADTMADRAANPPEAASA